MHSATLLVLSGRPKRAGFLLFFPLSPYFYAFLPDTVCFPHCDASRPLAPQPHESVLRENCRQRCTCVPSEGLTCSSHSCTDDETCEIRDGVLGCVNQSKEKWGRWSWGVGEEEGSWSQSVSWGWSGCLTSRCGLSWKPSSKGRWRPHILSLT